jgi:T5SS/PEP-CTERM-associated repeat protein
MVIGESGKANQMTTTNGGAVYSSNIIIGNATASSSNIVTITGTGSVWSVSPGQGAGDLELGLGGPANQLTISDGAAVHATFGILGGTSKNNVVTVTGAGSVWDSMTDLYVGSDGITNTLTIGPGGSVVATYVYVSYLAGAGNRINIEGGNLESTNVTIGNANCTATGQITVDAGQLLVTNAAHNAVLQVLSGTLTLNGGTTIIDQLVVTNSCARFVHAGGTLVLGNYVIDQNKFRSTAVTPSSNDVLLTWMMGPGATNALQAAPGDVNGGFSTNAFADIFVVTNNSTAGTVTNYLDVGGATNIPSRYYRVRLVP